MYHYSLKLPIGCSVRKEYCRMRTINREITKEEYESYRFMSKSEIENLIYPSIPDGWKYGLGWYGCTPAAVGGKYYIVHYVGESCD